MIQRKENLSPNQALTEPLNHERTEWLGILMTFLVVSLAALIALTARPAGATTTALETDAYGFVSRVEGDALLSGLEDDDAIEAEVNHPLLTGDQITTNSGRVEVVLPDGTVVRIGRGTSIVFEALSGAPDSEFEGGSLLTLDQGELQIRTPETFLGDEGLAITTSNATVYLGPFGDYRIAAQDSTFTEVVVREGFAEADTRSGSGIARTGEALEISGYGRPFVNAVAAGPLNSLELWAGDLDRVAYDSNTEEIDPRLAYAAAPLAGAGEWVNVDSRRAWRPYVRSDWRPFRYGRWVYTPSGLTWVASAPWGWVTSHYGSWDYVNGYGWLWQPGNYYMPAGVYWYWGPTHVAWIPSGYYSRHYRSGFRFGVYGWAGGDWGYWSDWTFCPTRYFGRRGYDRYWDSGRNMARERRFAVPRGIVTTDTRGLGPDRWGKPTEVLDTLAKRADPLGRLRNLPDVTEFVARRELAQSHPIRSLERQVSARERLQPLAEERKRSRFETRSVAADTSSILRSRVGVGSRTESRPIDRGEADARSGTIQTPSRQLRSIAGRRIDSPVQKEPAATKESASSLDRSRDSDSGPARRVLDRIRAHRESARGSSTGSGSTPARVSTPSSSGSTKQSQDKPKSVSKSSKSSSSKTPPKSSSASANSSGSSRSSARKSSPPSRSSSGRASSKGNGKSANRSRSKPHSMN